MADNDFEKDPYVQAELQMFNLYINLINIDGRIRDEEKQAFHDLIADSDLEDYLKDYLLKMLDEEDFIQVNYEALYNLPEDDKLDLLKNLIQVATADNEVPPSEKNFLYSVAANLGLDNDAIKDLMEKKFH